MTLHVFFLVSLSYILYLFNPYMIINFLLNELNTFLRRPTSQTALRWRWDEMPCWRTHTDASSQLRGQTCWRHDCGWSLREKRDWTMAAWPGSGSSSCLRRCSTRTTDCLSILPRESLFISCLTHHSVMFECVQTSKPALYCTAHSHLTCTDVQIYIEEQ